MSVSRRIPSRSASLAAAVLAVLVLAATGGATGITSGDVDGAGWDLAPGGDGIGGVSGA